MESVEMARATVHCGEMLPLLRRHEIQVLLRAGHTQRDVAERLSVSIETVRRVKREDDDLLSRAPTRRPRSRGAT